MSDVVPTCGAEKVGGDPWRPRRTYCGKPLRNDDQRAAERCGVHLAAERRRQQNRTARDELEAAAKSTAKRGGQLAVALADVGVQTSLNGGWRTEATLTLTLDEAERLLPRLRGGAP